MKVCEVFGVIVISALTVVQYSLPAPIIPLEMKRRAISQVSTGVAIASFSIGMILASLMPTDCLYSSLGRRKASQCGLACLSLLLFLYALSYFVPDEVPTLFLLISLVLRIL